MEDFSVKSELLFQEQDFVGHSGDPLTWKIECDAYIDDAPHQIENYVRQVPDKLILRFVREYNRPVKGAVDINNWMELTSLLEEHNL